MKKTLVFAIMATVIIPELVFASQVAVCKVVLGPLNKIHMAFDLESKEIYINHLYNDKNVNSFRKVQNAEAVNTTTWKKTIAVRDYFFVDSLFGEQEFHAVTQDEPKKKMHVSIYPTEGGSYLLGSGKCEKKDIGELEITDN